MSFLKYHISRGMGWSSAPCLVHFLQLVTNDSRALAIPNALLYHEAPSTVVTVDAETLAIRIVGTILRHTALFLPFKDTALPRLWSLLKWSLLGHSSFLDDVRSRWSRNGSGVVERSRVKDVEVAIERSNDFVWTDMTETRARRVALQDWHRATCGLLSFISLCWMTWVEAGANEHVTKRVPLQLWLG